MQTKEFLILVDLFKKTDLAPTAFENKIADVSNLVKKNRLWHKN